MARRYRQIEPVVAIVAIMHANGCNDRDIEAELGISRYAVYRWRHKNNKKPNKPSPSINVHSRSIVMDLWKRGMTVIEIARATGKCREAIYGIMKRMNLSPVRKRRKR